MRAVEKYLLESLIKSHKLSIFSGYNLQVMFFRLSFASFHVIFLFCHILQAQWKEKCSFIVHFVRSFTAQPTNQFVSNQSLFLSGSGFFVTMLSSVPLFNKPNLSVLTCGDVNRLGPSQAHGLDPDLAPLSIGSTKRLSNGRSIDVPTYMITP